MMTTDNEAGNEDYGELGISIEPLAVLEGLVAEKSLIVADRSNNEARTIVQRLAENAFNYLSSFVRPAYSFGGEHVVPLKTLEDWYNNCIRKATIDPKWLTK